MWAGNRLAVAITAAAALAGCATAQSATDEAMGRGPCREGVFEAWSVGFAADGTETGAHDRQTRYCLADGAAEMLEYRSLGPDLNPVFHGVTFAIWNAAQTHADVLWIMVGADGYTDIDQTYTDSMITATGEGYDPPGPFLERATTTLSPGGDEHFVMERSYDAGATWRKFNEIRYLATGAAPPPLATAWNPQLAGYAPGLVDEGGFLLLDGYAWADLVADDAGAPVGVRFATVVNVNGAWVWRETTWRAGEGVVATEDTPLGG